jgi:hypothetical protein
MAPKLPRRVAARPDPEQWGEDELMNLAEATALFWPQGPISERTLRTAVRDRRLPISLLARKFYVTKAALRVLSRCEPIAARCGSAADREDTRAANREDAGVFESDLAAIDKMAARVGRGRRSSREH